MRKVSLAAIVLLCNNCLIFTMYKILEGQKQIKNGRGIFLAEGASSFYLGDSKNNPGDVNNRRMYGQERLCAPGPAITYGLAWREMPKASLLLSMPVVTLLAGTTAYDQGLPLLVSIGCSFGTAVSYVIILKQVLR